MSWPGKGWRTCASLCPSSSSHSPSPNLTDTATLIRRSHLIEPRFDELQSEAEKLANLDANNPLTALDLSLRPYREALGSTPVIAAGNYNALNMNDGLGAEHDLVAFGRYFCSNEDLVERLRTGLPLWH